MVRRSADCVAVGRREAERAKRKLLSHGLIRRDLKARSERDEVIFPVLDARRAVEILGDNGLTARPCKGEFDERRVSRRLDRMIGRVSGYTLVGEIAIFNYRSDVTIEEYREAAEILVADMPRIRSVYLKIGTHGRYRLPRLRLLAGEPVTETVHKEYGIEFVVDVSRVYVNPRLSYEHRRIAEDVSHGEVILDMFTGYAPFPIHIASIRRATVLGVDVNPHAIGYALRSLRRNRKRLVGRVLLMRADSGRLSSLLRSVFDRLIMNNPMSSLKYVGVACSLLRGEGVVHVYKHDFSEAEARASVIGSFNRIGCEAEAIRSRIVLEYAPGEGIYVVDVRVKR